MSISDEKQIAGRGKFFIILNPVAGKGKAFSTVPVIEHFLKSRHETFEIVLTKSIDHARELAQNCPADKNTVVVAAGGDGTCNEVVNGLLRREKKGEEPPLFGILPIGRGNDFASSTHVSPVIEDALGTLVSREFDSLDAGFIRGGYYPDGRYFINGVGIGFDTMVGLEAAKMKHVHSGLAYVFGAVKMAVTFPASPTLNVQWTEKSSIDGSVQEKTQTDDLLIASIMNGRRMGGVFYMGPDAILNDGELDLCMVTHRSRAGVVKIIAHYTKGTQDACKGVTRVRSDDYTIKAIKGGMVAHADGETICLDGKELSIHCVPHALRLIGV